MRYNILSLSGGGYLGLYTARVLAGLEARSGRPLRESFDMVAGTSVGGILGLGVALGAPMAEVASRFERAGPSIFSGAPVPRTLLGALFDGAPGLLRAKYSSEPLREVIEAICGSETTLGALETSYLATAVEARTGRAHTFRTPRKMEQEKACLKAVDVALATSAAPPLFPAVQIGDEAYVDGGLHANAPDLVALHEAEVLMGIPCRELHMLSIGTTTGAVELPEPRSLSLGLAAWGRHQRILKTTLASQQSSATIMATEKLGSRYLRLDSLQDEHASHLALDCASTAAIKRLGQLAENTLEETASLKVLSDFLEHVARPHRAA